MSPKKLVNDLSKHLFYLQLNNCDTKPSIVTILDLTRAYFDCLGIRPSTIPYTHFYWTAEDYMAQLGNWTMISCRLGKDDEKPLTKLMDECEHSLAFAITELTSMGYKCSVSWVDKSNSFVFSVTGTDRTPNNNKKTVTSWSDDVSEAVFMGLYKVKVVFNNGTWTENGTTSNWG